MVFALRSIPLRNSCFAAFILPHFGKVVIWAARRTRTARGAQPAASP